MKRCIAVCCALLISALLCGCSMFTKEFTVVSDYPPSPVQEQAEGEKVTVKNFSALKQTLNRLVNAGESDSTVVFDAAYEGDASVDMASACWQVRTENAICVYCVENISYELSTIVTNTEAAVRVNYVDSAVPVSDIVKLTYFSGIREILENAYREGTDRVVLYVTVPGLNGSDSIEKEAEALYLSDPLAVPERPRITINTYNGRIGSQILFEIVFDYGAEAEELEELRGSMREFLDSRQTRKDLSEGARALELCRYLTENCELSYDDGASSPYSALLDGRADDEGLALAYLGLCDRDGIDCRVVYGQKNREDYCWNIIKIDGDFYHVDVAACIENGLENGFLLNDVSIWGLYRWDTASYDSCAGTLSIYDIVIPE